MTEQSPRADFNSQPLNLEVSEPDFARRRTAAQLPSFVRRVHPPEGFVSQEIDKISCEMKNAGGANQTRFLNQETYLFRSAGICRQCCIANLLY